MVYHRHRPGYWSKSYYIQKRLAQHGYHQSSIILGLWKHESRPIVFTLVVCRWFWSKICQQRGCRTPHVSTETKLWDHWRLGGRKIQWHASTLGLLRKKGTLGNVRICRKDTERIPAWTAKAKTVLTLPMCTKETLQRVTYDTYKMSQSPRCSVKWSKNSSRK